MTRPQFTQNNPQQLDVDLVCSAERTGRHEQQLVGLEKSQDALGRTVERSVGELRKDIKDLVIVLGKTIDDNHRAVMVTLEKANNRMDAMANKVSSMDTKVTKHDTDISDLSNRLTWLVRGLFTVSLTIIGWLLEKYIGILGGR